MFQRDASNFLFLLSFLLFLSLAGCGGSTNSDPLSGPPGSNPLPSITSLSPAESTAGSPGFTLSVNGTGFVPASTVEWEGQSRTTTYISSTELQATIPDADIATEGNYSVTVRNAAPGGGVSNNVTFSVSPPDSVGYFIQQFANDLVYDPFSGLFYFSIPSVATDGNSIGSLEPVSATLGTPVFVGSEPEKLALSDDGKYLYVDLDGAAAVVQFDLATQAPGLQFPLGNDAFTGPFFVEDMEVSPGNADVVAVSRRNKGFSPKHEGVAIYDNGVMRPTTTPGHTGSNVIEFSETPAVLYGYNNETTEFGFRRMDVDATGVTVRDVVRSMITGFGTDIEFEAGKVYATTGAVVDPAGPFLAGTFPEVPSGSVVRPDSSSGLVFFASRASSFEIVLLAYNLKTFTFSEGFLLEGPQGRPRTLLRWGSNGLAILTDADEIVILDSPIFFPSALSSQVTQYVVGSPENPVPGTKWTRITIEEPAEGPDRPVRLKIRR